MRLGQLARKYDISQQEITSYLTESGITKETLHSNSKLDDETEELIAKHFKVSFEEEDKVLVENSENATEESVETKASDTEESTELSQSSQEVSETENEVPKEDEVIETDKLLELLESEEAPVDLDKITLIKAPKKELEGLKVVGKIDLPEPKEKEEEETNQSEANSSEVSTDKPESKSKIKDRKRRRLVSDEELEERRLRSKRKKEEFEARKDKRRKEKEERERKARREAHYKQKMQQIKASQPKQGPKTDPEPELFEEEEPRPEPRTIFGKFWRWLNTP